MAEIHTDDLSPLLNSFNEGICYLNAQGKLLHYNEVAQRHWGKDDSLSNELILQSSVARALAGEHVLYELVHVDEQRILLVNTVPLHDPAKDITGVVVISLDVTTGRLIPIALFGSSQESYEEWHTELASLQLSAEHLLQSPSSAYLQTLLLARPLMYDFTSTSSPMFSNPRNLSAAIYAPVF